MYQFLRDDTPVARKTYLCDASEYVQEWLHQQIFTISEYREIVKAKRQGWKIQPGQKYIKQVGVDEGAHEMMVYRAIPDMHDLCLKYDLFPDPW